MMYKVKKAPYNTQGIYKVASGSTPLPMVVTIGGIDYEYVQVGPLYIIKENIKYHTSNYYYPNNDSSKENEMGLLYQAKIMFTEIMPILPTGWRIPRISDFDALKSSESSSNAYISTTDGGTDAFGVGIRLCGYRNTSGNFVYYGNKCLLWSSDSYSSTITKDCDFTKNSSINTNDKSNGSSTSLNNTALSVRVVKDV